MADPRRPAGRARFLLAVLLACGAGCGAGRTTTALSSRSLGGDPVALPFSGDTVVYAHDPDGDTSFFVTNIPLARILDGTAESGQILHVDLLWLPKAGATPMDPTATNSSVRHVVIAAGEVGVYGGAGFALPQGALGRDRLTLDLRDTSVRLLEATEGFADPLTPARITGTFTAALDPRLARRLHRATSQLVTNALGRSVFVRAGADERVALGPARAAAPVAPGERNRRRD